MTKPPSMWLNPFCDEDEVYCPFNPRFDDIYYVESDKAKRKYWQTWVSCPPVQIKKKQICCFAKIRAAPLRRRKHRKPKTACPPPPLCDDSACPRVKRRCHRKGRIPPDCLKVKRPLICTKPLTPYPAFSECNRLHPKALPLSECICWRRPMICEVWCEWRRRNMNKTAR
ncbi:GH18815 [Drosophila grimshawi]|uniref:GH18815 n=2 Tax=Drosophila grimshawi TaxID=7222 RepID=B4JFY1_DROGR|nr:GH18815 [Drosophila grimshawi]